MVASVYWEWDFFIQTIKLGVKLAFIYDGFLIFRLLCPHRNIVVSVEDLIYWIYASVIFFQLQLDQSEGVLRGFAILGIILGMMLYNKLFGEKLIALAEKWICFFKRRLTAIGNMVKIKLCRYGCVSKKNRREDGRKTKTSK